MILYFFIKIKNKNLLNLPFVLIIDKKWLTNMVTISMKISYLLGNYIFNKNIYVSSDIIKYYKNTFMI